MTPPASRHTPDGEGLDLGDLGSAPAVLHRLRNHLGALRAIVYRLQVLGPLTADQRELLGRCDEHAKRMTTIVTAVDVVARARAAGPSLDFGEVDVVCLVASVVDELASWATKHDLDLVVDPRSSAAGFRSHEALLQLAVCSLVEAAVTTLAGGPLWITVHGTTAELCVVVHDGSRLSVAASPTTEGDGLERLVQPSTSNGRELPLLILQRALEPLNGQVRVDGERRMYRIVVPAAEG